MTQESTNALIYRNLDLEGDLAGLAGLLTAAAQIDGTNEQVTDAALREQLTWSGQDPALNNWVVALADNASLVAYGAIQKTSVDANADLDITVHPSWRRQGIGSQLFAHVLARGAELKASALRAYVSAQNEAGSRFVRAHGFEPVSTSTRMRLTDMQSFPAPTLPHGFTTRTYDQIEQLNVYTEALNRCYEGYWGHLQCSTEDVARFLPSLNHAGIFLLFAPDGTIAGTCRGELSEQLTQERGVPTALLDAPGIVASYREADLALPLLLTAIHALLPQHPAALELESWGESPDMLARYRTLGFSTTKEYISYRRKLE